MNAPRQKYLSTRALGAPWRVEGCSDGAFAAAVVIPALAESQRLFLTLDSLAANPPEELERFLILVVVNHREDAQPEQKADNRETLRLLRRGDTPLRLGWVDAAAPGRELPAQTGGVGMARKLGLDLALPYLDGSGFLACLDADTLVQPDYLPALRRHFARAKAGGAVIPFRHQPGDSPREERAITLYELFLRHYVLGLKWAGSPYAYHTVGSAMACSVTAYLRMGGMNSRSAGEDFYFLQQLKRTAGIAQVEGCQVFPAARSSHRVPFGTGKSISRLLAEGEEAVSFYRPECFDLLGRWLSLVEGSLRLSGAQLVARAEAIHPELARFLEGYRLDRVWDRLRDNNPSDAALTQAFHGWFDGLKTVRLMHHLSALFPRCRPADTLPKLLARAGKDCPQGEAAQLELLRAMQYTVRAHSN